MKMFRMDAINEQDDKGYDDLMTAGREILIIRHQQKFCWRRKGVTRFAVEHPVLSPRRKQDRPPEREVLHPLPDNKLKIKVKPSASVMQDNNWVQQLIQLSHKMFQTFLQTARLLDEYNLNTKKMGDFQKRKKYKNASICKRKPYRGKVNNKKQMILPTKIKVLP